MIQNQYIKICCISIYENELSEREIKNKKAVPFKLASKRMNYIGINLRR